jgi:diguanylate cyclase (GGDEF)-like protein/hemerythrin-like metal-binding protein/PAS domain S-box-containing protein
MMLFVTVVTGCYLWIEYGKHTFMASTIDYDSIHWIFAAVIWLLGLAGIQYGFHRISTTSNVLTTERNNLLAIFDAAHVGMLMIDGQMNVVRVNQTMSQQFDKQHEEHNGDRHGIILRCPNARVNRQGCGYSPECNSCGLMLSLRETLQSGLSINGKEALLSCLRDGEIVQMWILYSISPIELGGERFALLSLMDVTERRDAETFLRYQKETYRALVENVPDVIVRYDQLGRRLYANPAYERLIGGSVEPLIGKTNIETPLFGEAVSNQLHQAIVHVLDKGVQKEIEVSWELSPDGTQHFHLASFVPEFDSDGKVTSVLCISRDITEIRMFQHQLQHMAFFDTLTKLPNRALFYDRLDRLVSDLSRGEQSTAGIMFLDLDCFKAVNDALGHDAGDQLLKETGARIRNCLREYDTVARLGGDEFAVILHEVRQELDMAMVARKILAAVEAPFYISGKELFISTSIGIACYPTDSAESSELIRFADAAMYHAKAMGRNNFQFYSAALTQHAAKRMELESDLRKALQLGELEVYYQPKVDTIIGLLVGAEALLRWNHPTRGMVPPGEFIGIAEDSGLIVSIGAWVLETACVTAREWNSDENYPVKIAINLSVRQFLNNDFLDTVRTVLAKTGCRPEWIELEITESLLMVHKPEIIATLEVLDHMGISIAIDDFGTGYSALSYLTDFPVSTIKIDKSFIRDILSHKRNLELVKAIVSMGHALGLELVAEGVETGEQAACLDRLGCHVIQGYFYGKSMSIGAFEIWRTAFFNRRQACSEEFQLEQSSWRDYLVTGHETIDSQHRELFKRITKLTMACRSGKGQDEVSQVLDYLGGYIKTHFSAEEKLLISVDSPQYKEHKAAHDNFTSVIDMLSSSYRENGETLPLTIETNYVAVEWLTKHICTMDRDLAGRLHMASAAMEDYETVSFLSL